MTRLISPRSTTMNLTCMGRVTFGVVDAALRFEGRSQEKRMTKDKPSVSEAAGWLMSGFGQ